MHWSLVCGEALKEAEEQIGVLKCLLELELSPTTSIEREARLMEEKWEDFEHIHFAYFAIESKAIRASMDQLFQVAAASYRAALASLTKRAEQDAAKKAQEAAAKQKLAELAAAKYKAEQEAAVTAAKEAVDKQKAEEPAVTAKIVAKEAALDQETANAKIDVAKCAKLIIPDEIKTKSENVSLAKTARVRDNAEVQIDLKTESYVLCQNEKIVKTSKIKSSEMCEIVENSKECGESRRFPSNDGKERTALKHFSVEKHLKFKKEPPDNEPAHYKFKKKLGPQDSRGIKYEAIEYTPGYSHCVDEKYMVKSKKAFSNLKDALSTEYFPLAGMKEEVRQQLVDDQFLFVSGDKNLIAAEMERDWHEGRGILQNKDLKKVDEWDKEGIGDAIEFCGRSGTEK